MRKRLIVFLVLIATVILPQVLFSAEKNNAPVLKFSAGACSDILNGIWIYDTQKQAGEGILVTSWLSGSTLLVECYTTGFCGGLTFSGSFELKGDSLILKYKSTVGDEVTSCVCFHRINFKLSDLPRKEYKIILEHEKD